MYDAQMRRDCLIGDIVGRDDDFAALHAARGLHDDVVALGEREPSLSKCIDFARRLEADTNNRLQVFLLGIRSAPTTAPRSPSPALQGRLRAHYFRLMRKLPFTLPSPTLRETRVAVFSTHEVHLFISIPRRLPCTQKERLRLQGRVHIRTEAAQERPRLLHEREDARPRHRGEE